MKMVMGRIISDVQSTFLKGRSILDGVLVANETVSCLKSLKRKALVFKVDFEKAYDSVNWDFLLDVLESMGFGIKWRKWIRSCLMTSKISILVNGSPTEEFQMEKGIRQGHPLAPFLFLVVAEGLHVLVEEALDKGLFKGIKVGLNDVVLSHLQYVDDVIFFGEWGAENVVNLPPPSVPDMGFEVQYTRGIQRIESESTKGADTLRKLISDHLSLYCVPEAEVKGWAKMIGCSSGSLPFTYLGLPVGVSMKRVSHWEKVISKIKKKLSGWKSKWLSFGGRLTLVKSVLSCIPLYYFSLFRAPRKTIVSIYGENGGLDLGVGSGGRGSSVWKSVINMGVVLDSGGCNFSGSFEKVVGDGSCTRFWEDRWVGGVILKEKFSRLFQLENCKGALVAERGRFIGKEWFWSWNWRRDPRGRVLSEFDELCRILESFKPNLQGVDKVVWNLAPLEGFSVKRFRQKSMSFFWRASRDRLLCRVLLDNCGVDLDSVLCPRCNREVESVSHSLLSCEKVKTLWLRVGRWWNLDVSTVGSLQECLLLAVRSGASSKGTQRWEAMVLCLAYLVWANRNKVVFNQAKGGIADKLFEYQRRIFEWISIRSKDLRLDWNLWLSDPLNS
ncbi:hypothetical protein OSB04_000508 [Centaurea solstitialis]|uniref:Reverse transcriptase domain-containing protein n=1 Tax=Centaurea solstitialis TaxID=347529 RepID=A0AA38WKL2_9ASTR|nr:hypothetical protein OSB04_000508 [Centaurea solstitialis]